MFLIMGQYKDCCIEEIDQFSSRQEAEDMLSEYHMAYGPDFKLWIAQR